MPLRSRARATLGRSYALSKRYARWQMQRRARGRRIVVFTMGKTGSTAVARAIADATGEYAFQVFRLRADGIDSAELRYRDRLRATIRANDVTSVAPFPGAMHLWQSAFLLDHPATVAAPWYVVTTVREPVAQAVSAFFHAQARDSVCGRDATPHALRDRLIAEKWLERPAQWFEGEFIPGLGIDVYRQAFDPAAATAVIEQGAMKVLLLRQENLDRAPEALRTFLGLSSPVPLARRNDASSRHDGERYSGFLRNVRLPSALVDAAYASAYSRHFYSAAELAQLRRRWSDAVERRDSNEVTGTRDRDVPTAQ